MTIQSLLTGVWQTHNSTITGFSGTPTQDVKYMVVNKLMFVSAVITGTSNATTFTFTIPSNSKNRLGQWGVAQNNATLSNGVIKTRAASNIVDVYTSASEPAWTASGTKELRVIFTVELE